MKYQVCIDLCNSDDEENTPILQSKLFDTEKEALDWLEEIEFMDELSIDKIMVELNDKADTITNSYII